MQGKQVGNLMPNKSLNLPKGLLLMAQAYEAKAEELYNFSDKLYRMGHVAWVLKTLLTTTRLKV